MAENQDGDELYWFCPEMRGIIPLDKFHIPKKLQKFLNNHPFEIVIDRDFRQVMENCSKVTDKRKESWINHQLIGLYCELHDRGYAHSIECWEEGKMVGGLYGVSINGAFFGESMFSIATDSSKVALCELVRLLKEKGFTLLDTQFINKHLVQFGAIEIPKDEYFTMLDKALKTKVKF